VLLRSRGPCQGLTEPQPLMWSMASVGQRQDRSVNEQELAILLFGKCLMMSLFRPVA
jgi:hypothetical protein